MSASDRVAKARVRLLLNQPWFGSLSLRLAVVEASEKTETMATDGTQLFFNPDWVAEQTDQVLQTVVAHETMHCALLHPYRAGERDSRRWNVACDHAVNLLLAQEGFPLWEGALRDPNYADMSAEQIYALLQSSPPPTNPSTSSKSNQEQPGEVLPAPPSHGSGEASEAEGLDETDWQIATEQTSLVSKRHGSLPGGADRAARASRQTATDWRAILRRFVEQVVPSDYSWSRPNRRYIAQGLYLPGVIRENTPRLGVVVDTSGSVGKALLQQFSEELTAILHDVCPEALDVVYCDANVQGYETFTPDSPAVELHSKGSGGTDFRPALEWFMRREETPAAVIYLTDLDGPFPDQEPVFPVLWATPEWVRHGAPFGEVVRLSSPERPE